MATHQRNIRFRIKEFLPRLKAREMTNREVANILEVSEEHVSRTLAELEFEKDPAIDRKALSAANKAKKARIRELAKIHSPEEVAKMCNISVRTAYRYKK